MANTIRAHILGCEHSQGTSKGSNRPYNFAVVNILGANDGWTESQSGRCTRVGLMQKTVPMSTDNLSLLHKLQTFENQFPLECDLVLDVDPNNIQKNWVVDIKPIQK
ncbi:hypothetical protein [Vibrio nitrifigilis]|uniref:Uncharacterized protein n=1 Tax=Vibrio nitrifigilis TaxID=2789781 RepID=A0ABS0GE14_9VIBR|nr:hypothetical protein [Vibrio nitrifigilis]MBF9000488.1 hypothetical protein [Vibrio nitrifigilis]MBF9001583.1 hypothetical protein [Vibrio nitrifigilis]MBF9002645.1 hypothetical protein [Vibrio nitrifigilis]